MSARKVSENWLLVELSSGDRDVVYLRSVLSPLNQDLKVGDVMTVNRRGEAVTATLLARAKERDMLDGLNKKTPAAGPSIKNEDEEEDFSSGASSWVPSDDGADSADEVKNKKIKLDVSKRQYTAKKSSKKIMTPVHRPVPVIPKIMQRANELKRKTARDTPNKSVPDSTKKNNLQNDATAQNVTIDVRELINIKNSFNTLFRLLDDLKLPVIDTIHPVKAETPVLFDDTMQPSFHQSDDDKENQMSENEEFNRSDDNILISNKYTHANVKPYNGQKPNDSADTEWIPIGSGKTLIHIDQFNKVNWRSYTIATRSLLLAVFPRRILATHSLTGKRSPAFQDKPAKMCLDPKIISDVIMEIMDRFNVRENLVRSIITTKCADECKMWKTRSQKKSTKKEKIKKVIHADDE